MKQKAMSFVLEAKLIREMKALAAFHDRPLVREVRRAFEEYLERHRVGSHRGAVWSKTDIERAEEEVKEQETT